MSLSSFVSNSSRAEMLYKQGYVYHVDIFFRIMVDKENLPSSQREIKDIRAFAKWLKKRNICFPTYVLPISYLLEYLDEYPMHVFFLRKIHLETNELKCIHVLHRENGGNKVDTYKTFEEAREACSLNGVYDPEIIRFTKNDQGEIEY